MKKYYFIVNVYIDKNNHSSYDLYIEKVKPIVESFGGKYLVRTNNIQALGEYNPNRVIVIEFRSKEKLVACFNSKEYQEIKFNRENSVNAQAIIVEGVDNGEDC